jgi:predicted transcriptional regulator
LTVAQRDPNAVAQQWSQRLGQSTDKIKAGIQGVNVAPGQLAARQKSAYTQNVAAAADKWARNVGAVSLGEWQQATIDKGVSRIAAGAQAAEPKMAAFMTKLLPYQAQLQGTLPARGGLDANINRMTTWVRGMSKFQK